MGPKEMRDAVRGMRDEYLANYTESFEAGIVGPFDQCRACVVGCMASPASESRPGVREAAYGRINMEPVPDHLEYLYLKASLSYPYEMRPERTAAFRLALYEVCVEEMAARASTRIATAPPEMRSVEVCVP